MEQGGGRSCWVRVTAVVVVTMFMCCWWRRRRGSRSGAHAACTGLVTADVMTRLIGVSMCNKSGFPSTVSMAITQRSEGRLRALDQTGCRIYSACFVGEENYA